MTPANPFHWGGREGEADGGYGRKNKIKKGNLGTKNAASLEFIKKI